MNTPQPTEDPVLAVYQAALLPRHGSPGTPLNHAHRLRRAFLRAAGTHCTLCRSRNRLHLAARTGASWDAAAACAGHAAILTRTTYPRRLALYAAAAASPRVQPVCPRCTPPFRIRRHLEALTAACYGPHHSHGPR